MRKRTPQQRRDRKLARFAKHAADPFLMKTVEKIVNQEHLTPAEQKLALDSPRLIRRMIKYKELPEIPRDTYKWAHPSPKIMPTDVPTGTDFYLSREWRELRYSALVKNGAKCQCCGRTRGHGVVLHVDHVKPISRFPHLRLELSNLQILCADCNLGKGAWDQTDWHEPNTDPRYGETRTIANNGRSVE